MIRATHLQGASHIDSAERREGASHLLREEHICLRRGAQFIQGGYYHIFNRGCNKANIFRSDENYQYLLRLLRSKIVAYQATVIAYCFMPNHYHILLRQDGEVPLSSVVQGVFNKLFEGVQ
ncbi:MAG: transposase [Ignavibacteria bacterium]|nr:transposase [Ignavibacteria bacterium]